MTPHTRALLDYLHARDHDLFAITGRIDDRRYLPRQFPADLPLMLSLQSYPGYRQMVGENWMHWHDYYEFWVATGGAGEYRSGPHQFAFGPGDVVLVDPLKLHGVLRMEPSHEPLVIFFRTEAVAPGGGLDLDFLSAWDRRSAAAPPRLEADAPAAAAVHGAMLNLARAWFESDASGDRAVRLKFHLLETLLQLRRAFAMREQSAPEAPPRSEREARLRQILEYVAEHCQGALSQPAAARAAGMSVSRFRAFFKETTGWCFGDYLRDLRLERAARLLRETDGTVAEIAYQTGFADQSHLQRLFKAKYEISPLAYRKRWRASAMVSEPFKKSGEAFNSRR